MTARTAESRELAAVIGLEVHVQLETETKIFCGCPTDPADGPNTRTCTGRRRPPTVVRAVCSLG